MQRFSKIPRGLVAIDGKTLRRSFDRAATKSPLPLVHARCVEPRLLFGQMAVEDNSNEITAVPKLLELYRSMAVLSRQTRLTASEPLPPRSSSRATTMF